MIGPGAIRPRAMRPAKRWLAAALLALGACATAEEPQPKVDLLAASYDAADALVEAAGDRIDRDNPIVYTPFLPVSRLENPTPLGRILAEQAASRLVQRGYPVVEVRLRQDIAMVSGGPFVLSDDARAVARRVLAKAALVGAYATTSDYVLLNVRLIDVATGIVLASHDSRIHVGFNERTLINDEALIYDGLW